MLWAVAHLRAPPGAELWLLTVSTAGHTSFRCSWTAARHSRATSAQQLRAKGSRSVWPGPSEALPLPLPRAQPGMVVRGPACLPCSHLLTLQGTDYFSPFGLLDL